MKQYWIQYIEEKNPKNPPVTWNNFCLGEDGYLVPSEAKEEKKKLTSMQNNSYFW